MRATFARRAGRLLLLALVTLPLGACDFILGEDPTPNVARIVVSGDGEESVNLLLSKNFLVARNEARQTTIELIEADTLVVTPPFERSMNIRDERQFFARARAADSVATTVRLRIFLDEEMRLDETQDLLAAPLQFLFLFNRPVLADVEVL